MELGKLTEMIHMCETSQMPIALDNSSINPSQPRVTWKEGSSIKEVP